MTRYIQGKPEPVLEVSEIESNIPIPDRKDSILLERAREMKVGDSITVLYTRNSPYASNMAKATGFKFTQRKIEDKLRIWRIK